MKRKGLSRSAKVSIGQGMGRASVDMIMKQRDLLLERQKVKERNTLRESGMFWFFT